MDLGLRDRVCVVTGSTGGIGLETARLLAAEGARVVVSGRDPARAERARADVGAHRAFPDLTDDQWDEIWQLNVMSYVRASRAAVPALKEAGKGAIVNVSSTA